MYICTCINIYVYVYMYVYIICMEVYVRICVSSGMSILLKLQLFNSVRSKYNILHLFKLFTMTCILFKIYGRQIHISL